MARISISNLPNMITAKFGLSDRTHELNRNMVMRDRVAGIHVDTDGKVINRRTGETLAQYTSIDNYKYKLERVKA